MSLFDPDPIYCPDQLTDIEFPDEGFVLYLKPENDEELSSLMGHENEGNICPYFFEATDDAYDRVSLIENQTGMSVVVKRISRRAINYPVLMYKGFNTKDVLVENV